MTPAPLISIVVPVFDDEATLSAALESCLHQTLDRIEIVCVDDASSDRSAQVIEHYRALDPRVRLIRHDRNLSAFEARRSGVMAAQADRVLFLDGDDELARDAAERALAHASRTGADLVGFGVQVVEADGRSGGAYERQLRPKPVPHRGASVLETLYPIGSPVQGQLWRFLFRTELVREAYALVPGEMILPRVNDLPLMFLVAALARSYATGPERLYRYHFGRGGSGHQADSPQRAAFYASAIPSIDAIGPAVESLASTHPRPALLRDTYESARLSLIGYVLAQVLSTTSHATEAIVAHLRTLAPGRDLLRAATRFAPETLSVLRFHPPEAAPHRGQGRRVLLATSTLRTGGISSVVAAQARHLQATGHHVTVVARSSGSDTSALPDGVQFVELRQQRFALQVQEWSDICRSHRVDVVIDHEILSSRHWPEFALAAQSEGAATVGWMHSFVGRPLLNGTDQLSFVERCSGTLAQLIVLSPLEVAYFRLRGVHHTAYLPNPPSPLALSPSPPKRVPPTGHIELIWWGRLEERTKRVSALLDIAVELQRLDVSFRLTVVGPDWDDMTSRRLAAAARRRGVSKRVRVLGAMRGARLQEEIDAAHLFVSTSAVEGYQLTIAEAQARGLPVVMFELPWLTLVQDNPGIISVPQQDARAVAAEISALLTDPERYTRMSQLGIEAARRATGFDFGALYADVVAGTLSPEFSPRPSEADAAQLLGLLVRFAEQAGGRRLPDPTDSRGAAQGLWRAAAPAGKTILRRLPWLRPLAHRAKGWLRLR